MKKFVEVNRINIVHQKVQSTKKSADICIKHHMKDDPEAQEVMDLLDMLDGKLGAMLTSRLNDLRKEAA